MSHKQANESATKACAEVERIRTEIAQVEEHIKHLKTEPSSTATSDNAVTVAASSPNDQALIVELTEQLKREEEKYQLLLEVSTKNEKELSNLQIDNQDLLMRLENIRNEKRTDLVARLELEGDELRSKLSSSANEIISMKTEQVKLELRLKELTERVLSAEKELSDRDEREKAGLSQEQETVVLKTQVTKQRNEIVMKSKAATAGWDAAADAEEKLDLEMEKAYQRGVSEGKKMNVVDLQSVHEAIEAKEQKIIELIEKCADAEKKALKAEKEMEEMEKKVRVAEVELEKARSHRHHQQGQEQKGLVGTAPTSETTYPSSSSAVSDEKIVELEEELEKSKERLDETQEEMVALSEQVEELQQALQLSEQKIQLLEQMVAASATMGTTAALPSSTLPSSVSASRSQLTPSFVDEIVNQIRSTIEKVPFLPFPISFPLIANPMNRAPNFGMKARRMSVSISTTPLW